MNKELFKIDEETLKQCKLFKKMVRIFNREANRNADEKLLEYKYGEKYLHLYSKMWKKMFADEDIRGAEIKLTLLERKLIKKLGQNILEQIH